MREATKSFFRLSWAMTVFGADQLASLLGKEDAEPGRAEEPAAEKRVTRAMDSVSRDTEKALEKRARSMYEAGDKLQSELVDFFFDSFQPEEWKPKKVLERAADWADRSADALRDLAADDDSAERDVDSAN
jgi:hypothetical protein